MVLESGLNRATNFQGEEGYYIGDSRDYDRFCEVFGYNRVFSLASTLRHLKTGQFILLVPMPLFKSFSMRIYDSGDLKELIRVNEVEPTKEGKWEYKGMQGSYFERIEQLEEIKDIDSLTFLRASDMLNSGMTIFIVYERFNFNIFEVEEKVTSFAG